MGWFHAGESGEELIIGDGTLDAVDDMIHTVCKEYQEDLNRKPSLNEMIKSIEITLIASADRFFSGCEELEITEIKAKTKRRKKKQSYQDGDFFAIPLSNKKFAFGRVLDAPNFTFGFLDLISTRIVPPPKLQGYSYRCIIICAEDGISSWRWKVIGNIPLGPKEYTGTEFWVKDQLDESKAQIYFRGKYRKATRKEANNLVIFKIWTH